MTVQAGVNCTDRASRFTQGGWGVGNYLWVTDHGRRLVEFTDG